MRRLAQAGGAEFRDAWGTSLTFEPARWDSTKTYYVVRSAGPDRQLNTGDDLQAFLLFHRRKVFGPPGSERTAIGVNIEHDRGPFNGLAEIVGTVTDPTGAVVAGASIEVREISVGKTRTATTNAAGQFSLSGVPAGDYIVRVSTAGFKIASQGLALHARDRAVLSATLSVGAVTAGCRGHRGKSGCSDRMGLVVVVVSEAAPVALSEVLCNDLPLQYPQRHGAWR